MSRAQTVLPSVGNGFLLMIPVVIWNLALTDQLPAGFQPKIFWKDIPAWLTYGENGSRILVFALAGLMPIRSSTKRQGVGFFSYLAGLVLYFAAWLALIYFPDSRWSTSLPGFMAPAFTPLFWLTGIGLIGESFYFNLPFRRWIFMLTAFLFVVLHCFHTYTVYDRLY
ncbi:hypothetical protein [Larkinella arboricola]